jgi:hypothetical protein
MFMFQICLEIVSMYPFVSKPEWNIKITLNYLMVHLCSTNVFLEAKSGVSTGSWPLISAKERIQRIIRGRPAFGTAMGCNSGLRTAVSGFEVFRQERLRFLSIGTVWVVVVCRASSGPTAASTVVGAQSIFSIRAASGNHNSSFSRSSSAP